MSDKKVVVGYKGFDKDLKCNGLQYEVGKEQKHEGEIKLCNQGLHFCEYPLFDRADWSKKETQTDAVQGAASATGDQGAASATGEEGCAVALGYEGKAKGMKGTWLTIAEWKEESDGWHRVDVQTVKVDGKKIKADTFYRLKGGKFVEAD